MNKTAIKNFSIWARNKLIDNIRYRAGLLGITENGISKALPQSAGDTEFYDIGTAEPYAISGEAVGQRRKLAEVIREKERSSDYRTAYQYIVEEVAYTWFNRLIAIRFMEVNDYLPSHIRVLSSDSGKLEPDLVTIPFDAELAFTTEEEQTILRFKQENQIDELFRLLFIKQCNALNEILPCLFEKTNDYTELLLSVSVVDRDSIVYRLTHDIDEEDFNIDKGGQVEIIGWLYQYWNTEPKNAVFGRPSGQKIKKEEIPAATQLFTPDWIVRYMVENSLGRIYIDKRKNEGIFADGSGLETSQELEEKRINNEKYIAEQMGWKYYIPEAPQEPTVRVQLAEICKEYTALSPENIKCIDPCMGSGHILCALFDVLMQIYESYGYSQRDAVQSIIQNNLYGLDIDKRATQFAYFSVMMKARQYDRRFFSRHLQPMIYCTIGDDEGENFGSLVIVENLGEKPEAPQNMFELADYEKRLNVWSWRHLLAQKYHVVVTNPPYMAVSNGNGSLQDYVKKSFPDSKADLFAVFIERCRQLVEKNGYQAMITQHAWMFINSYESLRKELIGRYCLVNMLHLGIKAFEEIGNDIVQTAAFVYANRSCEKFFSTFVRLVDCKSSTQKEQEFLQGRYRFCFSCSQLINIPGAIFAYWVSEQFIKNFTIQCRIEDFGIFTGSQNITGDNDRFLRYCWEVSKEKIESKKWAFYAKGGDYRQYYGNIMLVVDWSESARSFYATNKTSNLLNEDLWFREGITYSAVTSRGTGFRLLPSGCIFDKGGPSICVEYQKIPELLALLNSNVAKFYFWVFNPSINLQVKDVKSFPIILGNTLNIQEKAIENINYCKTDWDSFEISWNFTRHPMVQGASNVTEAYNVWEKECVTRFIQLKDNEEDLNRIFIESYGLQNELTPEVEDRDVTVRRADLGRDIRSLLSYTVGCMFGRYSLDIDGLVYAGGEWDASKYSTFIPDADGILPITDEEYLDDDIVSLLCEWLKKVYGADTLEQNLDFIAKALGNKGTTSREVIRNYFLKDFFTDHCRVYQKRPIYWLFDSGKQNGFKALIYLHRYTPDTIGNLRIDYLHRMQQIYESEIDRMQDMIDHSNNPRETAAAAKRKEKLQKQLKECREYDEKISHLALSRIALDLDDGVKVNYRKVQTAPDGKFYEVLADSRNIMGKK